MPSPLDDDLLFERLAAASGPRSTPAPERLEKNLLAALTARQQEDAAFEQMAAVESPDIPPAALRSRIYSALVRRQEETGPLLSLAAVKASGRNLCVFEELVSIAPVGEKMKAFNCCRICHARILAERMNRPPIWWPHCPYVQLKGD